MSSSMIMIVVLSFITGFFFVVGAVSLAWSLPERGRLKRVRERLEYINAAHDREQDPYLTILRDELLSEIPALHRLLSRFVIIGGLQRVINQANLKVRAGVVILGCVTLALASGVFLATFHISQVLAITVLFSLLIGCMPIFYILRVRKQRFRRFEEQLPDALELLARALRAGHAFTTAIEMISTELDDPVSTEFGKAFVQQNFGLPLRQSLMNLIDRIPLLDVQFFVTAVLIQKETGGNLAEILDNLSYVIRERFKLQGHIRAVSAQGRMTGIILVLLPIILGVLLYFANQNYIVTLFRNPTGRIILGIYGVFQILGFLSVRKIVRIRV